MSDTLWWIYLIAYLLSAGVMMVRSIFGRDTAGEWLIFMIGWIAISTLIPFLG